MDSLHARFLNFELFIQKELQANDLYPSLLCGGIAGVVAKTAIAPLERIKMSFQVTSDTFSISNACRRGRRMIRRDGARSLWRGHSTTILRIVPYAAFSYAFHDYAESYFKKKIKLEKLPFELKFLAGAIGGAAATLLTYPLDVLRVRMAIDRKTSWMKALKQGGFLQGLVPTMVGIIPYSGTAWCIKQSATESFSTFTCREPILLEALVINAFAGLCGQLVTYPLDIVRRRMQIASIQNDTPIKSFREELLHLYKSEGRRGITKGFSLNIVKGPLALSISLTSYDYFMKNIKNFIDLELVVNSNSRFRDSE